MKHLRKRKARSFWLAGITAVALLGIIALQAYWLRASFSDHRSRFKADVENAITSVMIKNFIQDANLRTSDKPMDASPKDSIAALLSQLIQKGPAKRLGNVVSFSADSMIIPEINSKKFTEENGGDSVQSLVIELNIGDELPGQSSQEYLADFKERLMAELEKKSISTGAELALVNATAHPIVSTIDTNAFRQIPVKSTPVQPNVSFKEGDLKIQAAFPDAKVFLLRRMAWLISVSSLLILVGIVSFTLLLRLFFTQKRLDDLRNDFMNNMTHELKTPVSSVSIVLELLKDKNHPVSTTTQWEYFSIAQGELRRLETLIDKVLQMSAFETSKVGITSELFDAAPWLHTTIASMKPLTESIGAQITTDVIPATLPLYADKMHLTNILQNLLENALKYNDKLKPQISVHITGQQTTTTMRVADNGIGIPATHLSKIFDKFFRVPTGNKHYKKGHGLGLSYVKAIAQLHGGTIHVASTSGKGSEFTIILPNKNMLS